VATASKWQPGRDVFLLNSISDEEAKKVIGLKIGTMLMIYYRISKDSKKLKSIIGP
jgi:hypothetical protein